MEKKMNADQMLGKASLTDFERRALSTFATTKYSFPPNERMAKLAAQLWIAGLVESEIFGGKVAYRTNAAGRAEMKRAGGTK